MFTIASRTTVAALGIVGLLALASPMSAQKVKSSSKSSRPSAARVTGGAKARAPSPRRTSAVSRKFNSRRPAAQPRSGKNVKSTVRVNKNAYNVRTRNVRQGKTNTFKQGKTRTVKTRRTYKVRSGGTGDAKVRRGGTTFSRGGRTVMQAKRNAGKTDRGEYANAFRVRRPIDRSATGRGLGYSRPYTRDRYDHRSYGYGSSYWYDRGYHRGYHYGFDHGYYYGHRHYYGPSLVFGFHYGGFGFYDGYWHFAIVVGTPIAVYRPYYYYYPYTWWDGRGASLVSWDRAVKAYPANYAWDLSRSNCVELWIATNDGADYKIRIDPAYYNARDPGELYAALWAELDQNGRLEIEDENGVISVFQAGMIRQIEATACR